MKVESTLASLTSRLEEAQSKQVAAQRDWEYCHESSEVVPECSIFETKSEFDTANVVVKGRLLEKKRLPLGVATLE